MNPSLGIDTHEPENVVIILTDAARMVWKESSLRDKKQGVLTCIEKILQEHALALGDMQEIRVHTGPGSYTGLRVGVAVGGMISYYFGIPLNGSQPGNIPVLEYGNDRWSSEEK